MRHNNSVNGKATKRKDYFILSRATPCPSNISPTSLAVKGTIPCTVKFWRNVAFTWTGKSFNTSFNTWNSTSWCQWKTFSNSSKKTHHPQFSLKTSSRYLSISNHYKCINNFTDNSKGCLWYPKLLSKSNYIISFVALSNERKEDSIIKLKEMHTFLQDNAPRWWKMGLNCVKVMKWKQIVRKAYGKVAECRILFFRTQNEHIFWSCFFLSVRISYDFLTQNLTFLT